MSESKQDKKPIIEPTVEDFKRQLQDVFFVSGPEEAIALYRKLSMENHPDTNRGEKWATQATSNLNAAWGLIRDRVQASRTGSVNPNIKSQESQAHLFNSYWTSDEKSDLGKQIYEMITDRCQKDKVFKNSFQDFLVDKFKSYQEFDDLVRFKSRSFPGLYSTHGIPGFEEYYKHKLQEVLNSFTTTQQFLDFSKKVDGKSVVGGNTFLENDLFIGTFLRFLSRSSDPISSEILKSIADSKYTFR